MAKVEGALFSLKATGKIGALVYEKSGSTNYVKANKFNLKPPSELQEINQLKYGQAIEYWQNFTDEIKNFYNSLAKDFNYSGFNLFIQFFMTNLDVGVYGAYPYNACMYG